MNTSFFALFVIIGVVSALPQSLTGEQPNTFQRQSFQEPQQFQPQYNEGEQPHQYIHILSKTEIRRPDQSFDLKYNTADGQAFAEKAEIVRNSANTRDVLVKSGHYAYTAPDGTPISVSYIADEFGFRAAGNHIPVAPTA